ncbi:hypothetical protein BGZ95_000647 [Linnemannia exigua]|uniref:F-box domain-containing protein n=1 Tax=Linnemannia exigua TaxID=604196 RepID=A0AAD4D7Y8_9FUNG|nr:hypothetical protein BGZ95_000647 [Linnemannia exigua]
MDNPTVTRNPFDLPELIYRLSRFVNNNDALSCALVSKAWTIDFVSSIWFQIDFDIHAQFADLSPDVVAKHGHHIRVVKNAKALAQVSALDHSNINRLRYLHIEAAASTTQQENSYRIVTRNNTNLQELILFAAPISGSNPAYSSYYVLSAAFSPSYDALQQRTPIPNLTSLKLKGLIITYSSLESILQVCKNLTELRLPQVALIGRLNRPFQHTGITLFSFGLKSIFHEDPARPSILSHFPNLTTLHTWQNTSSKDMVPSERIKKDLSTYCPHLTQYKLEDYSGNITPEFLTNIATNITRITFEEEYMSPETISAIILHQSTLKKVAHFYSPGFDYEKDEVPPVSDKIKVSDEMLQLIPRRCVQLERLNLHPYEMDVDVMEAAEWVCKDLKKLRIRVKGLDTKEQILRVIALWRAGCWRRWQEKAKRTNALVVEAEEEEEQEEVEKQLEEDYSIEARVARHLLKFEQLWWVWLGYQTWTPI